MEQKLAQLKDNLLGYGGLVIAYSGGVDSSFLTLVASKLPIKLLAITISSPLFPRKDLEGAKKALGDLKVEHLVVEMEPSPLVKENHPNRCYDCKKEILQRIKEIALEREIGVVAHGANADDSRDYRPGEKAAFHLGIRAPLKEVGLTKGEIRLLGKGMGLWNWKAPANVCLASRISYGLQLTEERLKTVEEAEDFLLTYAQGDLRVRIHDPLTLRLEVEQGLIPQLVEHREGILTFFKDRGYPFITIDLKGYRQGSINQVLEVNKDE